MQLSPLLAVDSLKVSSKYVLYLIIIGIEDSIKFLEDAKTRLKN
jgi:hypothetical protein